MEWKRRAIAVLLAVSMSVSACPSSAWAEGTLQEEISAESVSNEEELKKTLSDENSMSGENILSTEESMAEPIGEKSAAEPTMEKTSVEPTTAEPVVHTSGDFFYTELSDGTFSICGYNGKASEDEKLISVEIPASIDGVTVTQIGEKAFAKNEIVETIIFPESILSIAKDAFAECRNLKGIAFCGENPESASTIIQGCNEMEKIFILADKDFTVFQKQMAEDLGEETAKHVEVLEYEDLDKLETAYKEYVDSLGFVKFFV